MTTGAHRVVTVPIILEGWRMGDRPVVFRSLDLENYMQNPAVFFAHDYVKPPVGRILAFRTDEPATVDIEFVPADINPFAEVLYRLAQDGALAADLGITYREPAAYDEARGCWLAEHVEVVEVSLIAKADSVAPRPVRENPHDMD